MESSLCKGKFKFNNKTYNIGSIINNVKHHIDSDCGMLYNITISKSFGKYNTSTKKGYTLLKKEAVGNVVRCGFRKAMNLQYDLIHPEIDMPLEPENISDTEICNALKFYRQKRWKKAK